MLDVFILDMPKNWFISIFRLLCAFLDYIVYGIISIFFRTIFNLANFELIGFYKSFQERVYVILGIFMLFKVTVSLITYLVNPDKISDKERGVNKLVMRIIMVLVMLIALPTFFSLMTEFQNKLLPAIPRIIIGTSNTLNNDNVSGIASNMSLTMIQGFAHRKEECTDVQELSTLTDFIAHINDPCSEGNKTIYAYDYLPIISTIVGALACYVLFSLCITVAIRAFKMIILRMIAPIPVISYVDPKSSKDGMFSTWTKTLLSTWAELFILIGIIYFIVYFIDFVLSGDAWKGFFNGITNPVDGALLLAFLFIGLLFFAKQAPKFLMDALGIKSDGSFGKMLGLAASGLGMVGATRASYQASRDAEDALGRNHNVLKNIGAGLFGGISGGMAGAHAALNAKEGQIRAGIDVMAKRNATALSRGAAGSTLFGRMAESVSQLATGETRFDQQKRKLEPKEKFAQTASAFDKNLKAEAIKGKYGSVSVHGDNYLGDKDISGNSKSLRAQAQIAISKGEEFFYYDNGSGIAKKVSTTDYESIASDMEKAEMELLYSEFVAGRDHGNVDLYQEYLTVTGSGKNLDYDTSSRKNLDESRKKAAAEVSEIKRSTRYQAGEANSKAAKK